MAGGWTQTDFCLDAEPTGRRNFRNRQTLQKDEGRRRRRVDYTLLRRPVVNVKNTNCLLLPQQDDIVLVGDEAEEQVEADRPQGRSSVASSYQQLRAEFFKSHYKQILKNTPRSAYFQPINLGHTPMANFVQTCKRGTPFCVYHGTKEKNYSSIFERGLLIGGRHLDVPVVHGSAHGKGIYTAAMTSFSLSQSFTDSSTMLVCGLVDKRPDDEEEEQESTADFDGSLSIPPVSPRRCVESRWIWGRCGRQHRRRVRKPKGASTASVVNRSGYRAKQRRLGRFPVRRTAEGFIHVGDAFVVFDESIIAPLFVMHLADLKVQNSRRFLHRGFRLQRVRQQRPVVHPVPPSLSMYRKVLAVPTVTDTAEDKHESDGQTFGKGKRRTYRNGHSPSKATRTGTRVSKQEGGGREVAKPKPFEIYSGNTDEQQRASNGTVGAEAHNLRVAEESEVGEGRILWVPPQPVQPCSKRSMQVKREYESKLRSKMRSAARRLKSELIIDSFASWEELRGIDPGTDIVVGATCLRRPEGWVGWRTERVNVVDAPCG